MKKVCKRSVYTKQDAGNIFLFALLFPAVVLMAVLFVVMPVLIVFLPENEPVFSVLETLSAILSAQLGMFLVYLIYNKANKFNFKKASKISLKLNWVNVLISVVLGFVIIFGFNSLIALVDEVLVKVVGYTPKSLPLPLNTAGWLVINLVILAIFPAIFEELVFRGVVFNGLKQYGKKIAVIGSALLFALIHANIEQTVYPILFGIVLAVIVLKTDNIVYGMIAHFVNNAIVVVVNFLVNTNVLQQAQPASLLNVEGVFTVLAHCIIATTAIWLLVKQLKRTKQTNAFLMEDFAHTVTEKDFENITQQNSPELFEGENKKVWEEILCRKNDVLALNKANNSANTLLWVGVGIGLLMWIASLF